jgi:RNA polymerase sigma factor (sigma-70 family)
LRSKLMADNEPMVETFAKRFMKATNRYVEAIQDDLLQAARIGMLRALDKWDPKKGKFSTLAFFWMRYEMQLVLRHATPITMPTNSATIPKTVQDTAAVMEAITGNATDVRNLGVTEAGLKRAQKANMSFVGLHHAASSVAQDSPNPEEALDRKRDMAALEAFLKTLTRVEKVRFVTGKDRKLNARAKTFIERSRA